MSDTEHTRIYPSSEDQHSWLYCQYVLESYNIKFSPFAVFTYAHICPYSHHLVSSGDDQFSLNRAFFAPRLNVFAGNNYFHATNFARSILVKYRNLGTYKVRLRCVFILLRIPCTRGAGHAVPGFVGCIGPTLAGKLSCTARVGRVGSLKSISRYNSSRDLFSERIDNSGLETDRVQFFTISLNIPHH